MSDNQNDQYTRAAAIVEPLFAAVRQYWSEQNAFLVPIEDFDLEDAVLRGLTIEEIEEALNWLDGNE